jgi:hypothetical protein
MRYQSAEEMLAALERCMHRLSIIPSYRDPWPLNEYTFVKSLLLRPCETENRRKAAHTQEFQR